MKDKYTLRTWLQLLPFFGLVIWAASRWEINGWPSLVWLATMIMTALIRAPHETGYQKNEIVKSKRNALEIFLLVTMTLAALILPFFVLCSDWLRFADYQITMPSLVYIAAALQIPAVWLFWRSHADLGRNWSPTLELHQEQTLVTDGVYTKIRHPMYAAIWLMALGQPLLIPNWIGGFLVIPIFAWMYFTRIPKEEGMMLEKFPSQYEQYKSQTGRVLPFS